MPEDDRAKQAQGTLSGSVGQHLTMNSYIQRYIPWFFLAVSSANGSATDTSLELHADTVHTDRGAYFETVGMDRTSVYAIAEVGRAAVHICDKFLMGSPVEFPQRITVLIDGNRPKGSNEKAYTLSMESGGFVTLRIFWNEELNLEEVCHAITEAFLLRYVHYKYGSQATGQMRAWVIAALGKKCYIRYRPAEADYFAEIFPDLNPEIFAKTLTMSASEACDREAAYALFESFSALGLKSEERKRLLELALIGGSFEAELINRKNKRSVEALEGAWWKPGMDSFVHRYRGAVDSMEQSRLWLVSLADMETFAKGSDDPAAALNLRELGRRAANKATLAEIATRQATLLAGMLRVNPLYYNAAQSLGRYYEQILYGEPGFRRTVTLIDYLNDLNAARRTQTLAEKALDASKRASR